MTTLSVLIPNYNHGRYISHCLDRIFRQEFPPTEVIVVNDASTDDSVEIISRYASRAPRLRLYCNPTNIGVMKTMNRALGLARGDYIYGGAADDWVAPAHFQKAMNMLLRYPQAGLCFGYVCQFHADSEKLYPLRSRMSRHKRYFSPDELTEAFSRVARPGDSVVVPGNGAIWKRAEFIRAGGYQESLRWYGDWFTLQVVALRHGACFIPEYLAYTRVDHRSFSFAGQKNWEEQRVVLDRMIRLIKSKKFRDVLPRFQEGQIFSQMSPGIARLVVSQREHWDRDSVLLVENGFQRWWKAFLLNKDPVLRRRTATYLGRLGTAADEFVPELCQLVTTKPRTRPPVEMALRKICLRRPSLWPVYGEHVVQPAVSAAIERVKEASVFIANLGISAAKRVRALGAWAYRTLHWKLYRRIQALEERIAEVRAEEGQRYIELVRQLDALREEVALLNSRLEWETARDAPCDTRNPAVNSPLRVAKTPKRFSA